MQGLRLVAIYAIAIAAVIALQLWPVTGVVLMMMLGVVWAALLLNVMLLHVGLWAAIGKIERPWLALPLVVYAGWAAVGAFSYRQALNLQATMNAANDSVTRLPAGDHIFIVTSPDAKLGDATAGAFAKVLKNAKTYGRDRRFERTFDTRCQGAANAEWRRDGDVPLIDRSYTPPALRYGSLCLVSRPEPVPTEGVAVEVRPLAGGSPFAGQPLGKAFTLSLRTADGGARPLGELRQGQIAYLTPYPWFMAGCALMSAGPSWNCIWSATGGELTVGQRSEYGRYNTDMDQATFVAQRLGVPHY